MRHILPNIHLESSVCLIDVRFICICNGNLHHLQGLATVCRGTTNDKIQFIFNMYDVSHDNTGNWVILIWIFAIKNNDVFFFNFFALFISYLTCIIIFFCKWHDSVKTGADDSFKSCSKRAFPLSPTIHSEVSSAYSFFHLYCDVTYCLTSIKICALVLHISSLFPSLHKWLSHSIPCSHTYSLSNRYSYSMNILLFCRPFRVSSSDGGNESDTSGMHYFTILLLTNSSFPLHSWLLFVLSLLPLVCYRVTFFHCHFTHIVVNDKQFLAVFIGSYIINAKLFAMRGLINEMIIKSDYTFYC